MFNIIETMLIEICCISVVVIELCELILNCLKYHEKYYDKVEPLTEEMRLRLYS